MPGIVVCRHLLLTLRHLLNGGGRAAKLSADEDAVADPSTRAQHGLSFGDSTDHDDVGEDSARRLGRVASGKGDTKSFCQTDQAASEACNPGLRQVPRQRQREEGRDRLASHGGDVAEPPHQAAMPDGLGRMPVTPKMNSLQGEVGRDQRVFSRGNPQDGAVVPDAHNHVSG